MILFRTGLVCLLTVGIALGQTKSSTPATHAPTPALKPRASSPAPESKSATEPPSTSADSPVITVEGLCERPAGSSATPSDCRTVITRAQFEKVVNAVQPNMPPASKKQFAGRYVTVLILAEKAHELGLDSGPDFDQQMYLSRIQILSRLAGERLQKEAAQVSDSEVQDYYREHAGDYKAISFDKLYIPKQKQSDLTALKPNDPDAQKKREASEAAMKEEADKLRARASAGEDFTKLQQEAYDFAGSTLKPSNAKVEHVRKTGIPPTDASIFDLKKGDVSQVFDDPGGFMVYKIEAVEDLPVTSVRDEIVRKLETDKIKSSFDALQNSAKTTLDEAYFATPAPPAPPTLRNPGEAPAAQAPPPGKK